MKTTDIPNGFVVIGQMGLPVLIDFVEDGTTSPQGTELNSDGWLSKGGMGPELLALVHTVKGEEKMLIRALLVLRLSDNGKPITAVRLGRANKLLEVAKKIRDKYIDDVKLREQNPEIPMTQEYKLSDNVVTAIQKT
jgi:hypothetical protein